MDGSLSITESLQQRLALIRPTKAHIQQVIRKLKKSLAPSVKRNKAFFAKNKRQIYVISSGFREYILPVTRQLSIPDNHVFANTFTFEGDTVTGFDASNPLAQEMGKVKVINSLKLERETMVVGDGYTDYEMKRAKNVTQFYAFTENVHRPSVVEKADAVVPTLDEFLYLNGLPSALSYPKNRIKVLLLENINPRAVSALKKEGYQVETAKGSMSEEELSGKIKDVSILGIRSKTQVTERVLKYANRLLAIGAFCIGTNQINLPACQRRAVAVFNAPYSNTRSVVELVIGEIIMLLRGIPDKSQAQHAGKWQKSAKGHHEIRGKTLGIIGYGNIGSQLSVLAEALGMDVIYYDIVEKLALGNAKKCTSMKQLLGKADIITVHVDGSKANTDLIAEKEFKAMKDGVIFLNLSRGFVVDIPALARNIRSGKIKGAAVDVFPNEPKNNQEPFKSELQGLPNTILSPHVGGSTEEAQANIADFVSKNLINFVNTGSTFMSVNFPRLQLQEVKKAHRLIHIHHNKPGVLAEINNVFARNDINILGQYLKTNEEVGYVITDVGRKHAKKVLKELRAIAHTIRLRTLY